MTIAVVDDDQDTQEFLYDFFAMLGITVVLCPPDDDVRVRIAQTQANAVILDVFLNGMTGVDVLHQLRREPTTQALPIIFFSGSREKLQELLPDYTAYGAIFIPKPDVQRLKEVVENLTSQPA